MAATINGSSISANTLAQGLWYAIEQCGVLLSNAVNLYEQAQFASAVSLALLANEEFGKSRNLLDLWDEAEKGNSISTAAVQEAMHPKTRVHQKKQAAALVGLSAGVAMGTEIGSLLHQLARSLKEIRDARIAKGEQAENLRDELLADPRVQQLAEALKNARERVLYVDFDSSNRAWLRPRDAFGTEVKELAWLVIVQVRNIYANVPGNLLQGTHGAKLAMELNSWAARPVLPSVPEEGQHWN